jgi:UDP-N-acetylmuramoyl-tripeptide--D-alanyl-D-alanine ligase
MRKKKTVKENSEKTPMSILWDATMLSEALSCQVQSGINVSGVSIDSRTILPGEMFVAIKGEKFNGDEFAHEALKKGAALAIVSKQAKDLEGYKEQVIYVDDTLEALNKLAVYARKRLKGQLIAVTGSVGKTSTKEMLHLALDGQGQCYSSKGNFNNHWGMPLCLANMPAETDYAIMEMGMSSAGEIAHLSRLAVPHVAIITTIEAVHLEFFNSISAIAAAKAEIFTGMVKGGTAIINYDNPYHPIILGFAQAKAMNVISFGSEGKADFKLERYEAREGKSYITAECLGKDIDYTIGAMGRHLALNSLAVLAAVHAVGAEVAYAARCLEKFSALKGRGATIKTDHQITIIDDSYNASPASVKAALANLATYRKKNNRLIAILGNMMELGPKSAEMHVELLADITKNNVDRVYTVGHLMHHLHEALPANIVGINTKNSQEMAEIIESELKAGDVVLIKGSLSMQMKKIVDKLL